MALSDRPRARARRLRAALSRGIALSRLAPSHADAIKLLATSVMLERPSRHRHRVVISERGRSLGFVVDDPSQLEGIKQVFVRREYEIPPPPGAVDVVVDLGSNIGAAALFFRARFPHARVIAVEPDPVTFEKLALNGAPQAIEVHQLAVAGEDAERMFHRHPASWGSSLLVAAEAPPPRGPAPVAVRAARLDSLCDELGLATIDVLKMDIEGAEVEALERFTGADRVRQMLVEVHTDIVPSARDRLSEALLGFEQDWRQTGTGEWFLRAERSAAACE
jgi:FkbM family methyltransferase